MFTSIQTPLELLNQFDLSNPDHLTVITKDDKLTISVLKDGVSLTLGYPLNTKEPFNTNPRFPLQQPQSVGTVVRRKIQGNPARVSKLNEAQVIEIKMMLADKEIMGKFPSMTKAYQEIGRAYNITTCAVSNIARGISWKHVKI